MWPDSEFATPTSSFERPVPLVLINPDSEPYLYFRFNKAWLPYVLGALKQLMLQTTWDTSDPDVLNLQQMQAGQILYEFSIATGAKFCNPDGYEVDMTSLCEALRIHNGKLQGLCCGEWSDIAGQEGISIGGPQQEGGGSPQPTPGGGCQVYHAQFAASSQYLVPTVVNAGDTVEFTNAVGAGHDGSTDPWNCPDGSTFFAGACVGVGGPKTGDPSTSINHMALIAKIGAVWYPASSGVITVPGGIANEQVIVQVNDTPLGDNSGSYTLDVKVCNNASVGWTQSFNFALAPQGWIPYDDAGIPRGIWSAGDGWMINPATVSPNNNSMVIDFTVLHNSTITQWHNIYTTAQPSDVNDQVTYQVNGATIYSNTGQPVSPGHTDDNIGSWPVTAGQHLRLFTAGSLTNKATFKDVSMVLTGTGINPFV